ncbi:hypothetical protein OUZ56_032991 [Daphnia magna]|uniref:Uncharacterized protein n=1 Tax=Daphnia magna TaxID=35525 RepID=A0ABR0B9W4_9CRUS|nr:hypothetical protein OUZ56_032991 [Daphnia magna]
MIDDVITGGPKLLRSPVIKPIVPKTTAIPDKIQGGKASEKTIEAVKKSASPIFKPKVKQDDAQLKKLRSNVAVFTTYTTRSRRIRRRFSSSDEQVAIPNTSHQEPEGERNGFPVKRPEDPDPTNLVAKGHPIDISLSEQPADNGVEKTNVSSEIFDGDSRVTYAIGTTDPGDKITSDQTGQLPSSHQTKQRAVGGEHQTNANPNQNKLETIVTIEYHKPTEPSTTAVETQTTSEDITTHRLTSHPAITQSVPKSTTSVLGTTVVSATKIFMNLEQFQLAFQNSFRICKREV